MTGGGASIIETTGNQGQMSSALQAGIETLDLQQTVVFELYKQIVLPVDGFVFWTKASLLAPGTVNPNYSLIVEAKGSLHHTTINRQDPDESFSVHRMVFTSLQPINNLGATDPEYLYLATTDGEQYAFSTRSGWYRQSGLYHYSGDAVYPTLSTQILNDPNELGQEKIVSNSLPIWLKLNQLFPVYPGYLLPDNLNPPYAVIDIGEDDTYPMQSAPFWDRLGNRWQLTRDRVRVVTYGIRNNMILDWMDSVQNFALNNPEMFGIMNSPVPKDAKRGQIEINTIAQKKVIVFEVNYYQTRVNSLAQQLIKSAFLSGVYVQPEIVV
jgi:hypothetical protein